MKSKLIDVWNLFIWCLTFNCYLAAPRPTLVHYRGGSLSHPMLITCVLHIRPEGHQEPCNKVGSLRPVECLEGFRPRTFQFWSQHLKPLGHSPVSLAHLKSWLLSLAHLKSWRISKRCSLWIASIIWTFFVQEDICILLQTYT